MKCAIIDGFDYFDLSTILANMPFDKVFYIAEEAAIKKYHSIANANFYDCHKIALGDYPDDFAFTEPLDEETIQEFSDCESITMKMFERNDFWFQTSFNQRKEWYLIHLRYWYHMIYKNNVVCFMKSNFPHEVYDYIIYSIIRRKGEKCFFFSQISFMNRFVIENDVFSYPNLNKFLENFDSNIEICNEVKKYLELQRQPAADTKDAFQIIEEQRGVVKNQHKIISVYNKKYAVIPDIEKKYVYLALHMQPEMTTCPLAGQFVYQDLIIELLDYYLPDDMFIYVKEHPAQTKVGRSYDFYKKFYNRSRVKFVKSTINSRILLDNSIAVATCSGSVGWESLIRCKPVLLFGNFFYQMAPGCFPIKTKKDLVNAITELLKGVPISKEDVNAFFQHIYDYSYRGYLDPCFKDVIGISEDENSNTILKIINEIISLF